MININNPVTLVGVRIKQGCTSDGRMTSYDGLYTMEIAVVMRSHHIITNEQTKFAPVTSEGVVKL